MVATTNETPTVLSAALLDRFDAVLKIEKPNPAAFDVKHWHNHALCYAALSGVYLGKSPKAGSAGRPIGLRAFKSIDRLNKGGLPLEEAARIAVGEDVAKWLVSAIILSV